MSEAPDSLTETIRLTVGDEGDGVRLDRFLASVLPDHSRSQVQRLIKTGHVHVDERAAKVNQAKDVLLQD